MLVISWMRRVFSINGAAETISTCHSHSTGRLLFVAFVLYVVCQVQLFVNRRNPENIANVLSELQQASERISNMEMSLVKVESALNALIANRRVRWPDRGREKRQTTSSILQEIRRLKRDQRRLDSRVQCLMSDNGTDNRGKPCPADGPGKMMYRKSGSKGEQGDRINPTKKPKDKTKEQLKKNSNVNGSPRSSQTSAKKAKRKRDLSTSYIHWGMSKCPRTSETTRVYSGGVASSYSNSSGGVSEYLCMPGIPLYTTPKKISNDSIFMFPVKYGRGMSVFRKIGPEDIDRMPRETYEMLLKNPNMTKTLDLLYVPCAMCRSERRTTAIVVPARNACYPGWRKEYHGYLMSQQDGGTKSQFICVDADADGLKGSHNSNHQGPLLQPTAFKCHGSTWCSGSPYSSEKAVTCVVCTI